MDGFVIQGKAFCVVEDLRLFAEQHKGITMSEWLKLRRLKQVERAEAKQFGMSQAGFREILNGTKRG